MMKENKDPRPSNKRSRDGSSSAAPRRRRSSIHPLAVREKQSIQERRLIRARFDKEYEDNKKNAAALGDSSRDDLMKAMTKRKEIYEDVYHSTEAYKDAQLGNQLTDAILRQSRQDFSLLTPLEFFRNIKNRYYDDNSESLNWSALSQFCIPVREYPMHFGYVSEVLDDDIQEKRTIVRRTRTQKMFGKDMKATQPNEFAIEDNNKENDQQKRVDEMSRHLNRARECDFFEFVCNPISVAQTCENIFDLAFLVKNDMAVVFLKDGIARIRYHAVGSGERKHIGGKNISNNQLIWQYSSDLHSEVLRSYGWTKDTPSKYIPDRSKQYNELFGQISEAEESDEETTVSE